MIRGTPEEVRQYNTRWARENRIKNCDAVRSKGRQQYQRHRVRILKQVKQYQELNVDAISQRRKKRYQCHSPEAKRRDLLMRNYGITPEQYDALYAKQAGACAICAGRFPRLQVDHCHKSDVIRGLLCGSCNRAIGLLSDNPVVLASAAEYLRNSILGKGK